MKKTVLVSLLLILLAVLPSAALANVSKEYAALAAEGAFPGWTVWHSTWYGSGRWQDEIAIHTEVLMYRVDHGMLETKILVAVTNGISNGEEIPWNSIDYAPVPLDQEAERRIMNAASTDVMYPYEKMEVAKAMLPGCAPFLLSDAETLDELLIHRDFLVASISNQKGQFGLRIAHWNGQQFDRITASPMQEQAFFINEIHSTSGYLEIYSEKGTIVCICSDQGDWQLHYVDGSEGVSGCYSIEEGYLYQYDDFESYQNNDQYHYGRPTFPVDLADLDFSAIPYGIENALPLLDTDGWACVKTEGAGMYGAPEGRRLASCYARLVGVVAQEKDGWVRLQIGSEEQGRAGWFKKEDLAFGSEMESVICSFPSFTIEGLYDMDDWDALMPGAEMEWEPWQSNIWLIGKTEEGNWLVQIEMDLVTEWPETRFASTGPTEHTWEYWDEDEETEPEEEPGLG